MIHRYIVCWHKNRNEFFFFLNSAKKRWHSKAPLLGLFWDALPPPPESVRTAFACSYGHVITKFTNFPYPWCFAGTLDVLKLRHHSNYLSTNCEDLSWSTTNKVDRKNSKNAQKISDLHFNNTFRGKQRHLINNKWRMFSHSKFCTLNRGVRIWRQSNFHNVSSI